MRKTSIAVLAASAVIFAAPTLAAESSKKNENIGVGSGLVVGALAGGPAGAIIGAAIGGYIGDSVDHKNERIARLQTDVDYSNGKVARLEHDIDALGAELDRLNELARPELLDLMQAGIEMDLLFRTDEAVVADTTGVRLATLAGTLARMSDVRVQLDGYADERGNAEYNQALSERRASTVANYLVMRGVSAARVRSQGFGETMPIADNETIEGRARNRRVEIKIVPISQEQVEAARQQGY